MSEASERLRRLVASAISWAEDGDVAIEIDVDAGDITAVLDELAALEESHKRLSEIYTKRGETIASMRSLLDSTS